MATRGRKKQPGVKPLVLPGRMTGTDALFWYGEAALPEFRPIIAGLYRLDRAPDPARIEAGLEAAIAIVPRLRQRVVEAPWQLGLPQWVDDPHFDRAYHFRHLSLPAPGTQRALLDLVAALFATPLDRQRPLWEATWIDGLEGGRSALLFKLHHAVVDGVGSVAILEALTGRTPEAEPPRVARPRRPAPAAPPAGGAAEQLLALARDQLGAAAKLAGRAVAAPGAVLASPREAAETAMRTLRGVRALVEDAARPPVHDPLAIPGSGLSRRLDVEEVPIERLRKIKAPLGVTINDVVLTALAGAIGAYHRERHVHADELVCMVPMNLRRPSESDQLGNRVGMFGIALPVGEPDPAQRLARVVEQTRAAKSDRRGAAGPLLAEAFALLPGVAMRLVARQALGRVNVACTNVPGVAEERWMAGARVESIHPFASVVEGTPIVMALLSYAGRMEIGIDTDPEAIPDPERIGALFSAALGELEELAGGAA